jgi:hypothetical protein
MFKDLRERKYQAPDSTPEIEGGSLFGHAAATPFGHFQNSPDMASACRKKFRFTLIVQVLATKPVIRQHSVIRVILAPFFPGRVAVISYQRYPPWHRRMIKSGFMAVAFGSARHLKW